MRKSVLFLALLLVGSIAGCDRGDELEDTITKGTWRVSYYVEDSDDHTPLFHGYVFTFLGDGTVTVSSKDDQPIPGTWDEDDNGLYLELYFGDVWPLEKLNEDWVVDLMLDDELRMHERSAPAQLLYLERR